MASPLLVCATGATGSEVITPEQSDRAELLDAVFDAAAVAILGLAFDGTVVLWNHAAEQLFGWSATEILGRPDPTVAPDLTAEHDALRADVFAGRCRVLETQRLRRDGSRVPVTLVFSAVSTAGARIAVGICHAAAERHELQAPAHAAAQRMRAILDSVPDFAMLILAPDGTIVDSNRGAERLLGWSRPELAGRPFGALYSPDTDRNGATDLLHAAEQGTFATEARCVRRGDARFWGDLHFSAIRDRDGALTNFVTLLRDVSERKREQDRERRRLQQSASVAAFAQRAAREQNAEAVAEAAVEHLAAAVQADYAEIMRRRDEHTLALSHAFGWGRTATAAGEVQLDGQSIYTEALEHRSPVARALREEDFRQAPHLRALGVRFAAVTVLRVNDDICTLAAFSRTTPLHAPDVYPLQAIATASDAIIARREAEARLADRERTLSMLLDQMPAMLWTVDHDLRFTSIQGAGLQEAEADPLDVLGLALTSVLPAGSPVVQAAEAALRGTSVAYADTFRGRAYENRTQPLRNRSGDVVGAVNLAVDVTDQRHSEEELRASREELRRLSARMNRLQEEERRRIAHELHDELGQRLTALRMEASLLPYKIRDRRTREAGHAIEAMLQLIDETIHTVRRVATELRPPVLDHFGFRAALETDVAALQKRSGIDYELRFLPDDLHVRSDAATALYRIAQEALTNVARHSGATAVRIGVELRDDWVVMEIDDNGRGITRAELESATSLGLLGMRERALALGGDLVIEALPVRGTRVSVRLPAGAPA